jgi:hypothetical protein
LNEKQEGGKAGIAKLKRGGRGIANMPGDEFAGNKFQNGMGVKKFLPLAVSKFPFSMCATGRERQANAETRRLWVASRSGKTD